MGLGVAPMILQAAIQPQRLLRHVLQQRQRRLGRKRGGARFLSNRLGPIDAFESASLLLGRRRQTLRQGISADLPHDGVHALQETLAAGMHMVPPLTVYRPGQTARFQPLRGPRDVRQERVTLMQRVPAQGDKLQGCSGAQQALQVLPHTAIKRFIELRRANPPVLLVAGHGLRPPIPSGKLAALPLRILWHGGPSPIRNARFKRR